MAYKLIIAAQDRWRAVNAPHLFARACATFNNGVLIQPQQGQHLEPAPGETAA